MATRALPGQCQFQLTDAVDQLAKLAWLQAGQVIRPFHPPIQGDVPLHQLGAQGNCAEGNGYATLMAGVANQIMQFLQPA